VARVLSARDTPTLVQLPLYFGISRRTVLVRTFACCLGLMATAARLSAAAPEKRRFDVPADLAEKSLPMFSVQSGFEVLFSSDAAFGVRTHAIKGEFLPGEAVAKMLAGTTLCVRDERDGVFRIAAIPRPKAPGAALNPGKNDRPGDGNFGARSSDPPPGPSSTAQPNPLKPFKPQDPAPPTMKNRNFITLLAAWLAAIPNTDAQTTSAPARTVAQTDSESKEQDIQKLASYYVTTAPLKAFEKGANMDIPRTSNDIQAYTIINQQAIEESNRLDVGDFLKDVLTQNTNGLQYNQTPGIFDISSASTSQVNLRGLGNLQTLMLINGTRLGSLVWKGVEYQPNVNQIPLGAIDHIEVLSTSASAIYGSSAVGGMVNIILKKNFSGGTLETSYQNTMVSDNPQRMISLYDSFDLKKTHVNVILSYSDGKGPVRQDRPFIKNNFYRALANAPGLFYSANTPYAAGSLPNIALYPSAVNGYTNPSSKTLTFKNGVSIGSTLTYIPAGTSLDTTSATLNAGLAANAGKQNLDEAESVYRGSHEPLLNVPQKKTIMFAINHQFSDKLEVFLDFNVSQQKSTVPYLPLISGNNNTTALVFAVPGNAPTNPFQQNVLMSQPLPLNDATTFVTTAVQRTGVFGLLLHLPNAWEAIATYSYAYGTHQVRYGLMNFASATTFGGQAALLYNGTYNPFVDSMVYDQKIAQNYGPWVFYNPTHLLDFNARASGPLFNLPGGSAKLTIGTEARLNVQDINYEQGVFPPWPGTTGPNVTNSPWNQGYMAEKMGVKTLYAEMDLPVISPKNNIPFVKELNFQLAGRIEDFNVIITPDRVSLYPLLGIETHTAAAGRLWSKYTSANPTFGFKHKPVNMVTIRGSYSAGFVPPTYLQLGGSSTGALGSMTAATFDPATGLTYTVPTNQGTLANPDLNPTQTKCYNLGVIFQPQSGLFRNFRLNVEFIKIKEYNIINKASYAQALLAPTLAFLIPRDPITHQVTSFTSKYYNLQQEYTDAYDVSLDYRLKTAVGTVNMHAAATIIEHLKMPYVLNGPLIEYSGFAESGGAVKTKANGSISWLVANHWTFGWNARYWDSYKQAGYPSDPQYNGAKIYSPNMTQIMAQAGPSAVNAILIPAQIYHSAFALYRFGNSPKFHHLLAGASIQLGVNNVFNTAPPYDAAYSPLFYSPYGSLLLRTYIVKFKRDF